MQSIGTPILVNHHPETPRGHFRSIIRHPAFYNGKKEELRYDAQGHLSPGALPMNNLQRYQGWALITGASSGIGREFARQIAAEGVNCVLVARRRTRLDELAEELTAKNGVLCRVMAIDLAQDGAPEHIFDATRDIPIGLLVNNAGFGAGGRFETAPKDRLSEMVKLNCDVVVRLTHLYLPQMLDRKCGGIVIVASVLGVIPTPYDVVYGATKAFDLSFAEALWAELRGTGVDVTALCPGGTNTEFLTSQGYNETRLARKSKIFADADRIAAIALRRLGKRLSCGPIDFAGVSFLRRFLTRKWTALIVERVMRRFYDIKK
ncbi:MAG: hypothetical protein AMXMBFR84_34310 [Candidatus Hydrogenedentota bacterium]